MNNNSTSILTEEIAQRKGKEFLRVVALFAEYKAFAIHSHPITHMNGDFERITDLFNRLGAELCDARGFSTAEAVNYADKLYAAAESDINADDGAAANAMLAAIKKAAAN